MYLDKKIQMMKMEASLTVKVTMAQAKLQGQLTVTRQESVHPSAWSAWFKSVFLMA